MKHFFKKLSSVCTPLLCALLILSACTGTVWASSEDALQQTLIQTAEGLTQTILVLSDEEISAYANSGDEFTETAMTAWMESRQELGAAEEDQSKAAATEVSYANGEYTVTVQVIFENYNGEFEYLFNEEGTPESMAVNVIYPLGETLRRAGMNTAMGLAIVFIVLTFLTFVISLFKYLPNPEVKKKEEREAEAVPVPPAPVSVPAEEYPADDTELIAVIAAAIAAAEGTAPDGFVVRSIRKINRKKR